MRNVGFIIFCINIAVVGAAALIALISTILAAIKDISLGGIAAALLLALVGGLAVLFLQARIN
jgi:hypothetical protein